MAHSNLLADRIAKYVMSVPAPATHDRLGQPLIGPCLLWQRYCNEDGYGIITFNEGGRQRWKKVHRLVFALFHGRDVDNLDEIDHRCRRRNCAAPLHLEEVTHAENIKRGDTGIVNRSVTHCPKGHPYDEANTVHDPRPRGGRSCRQCRLEYDRLRQRRKRAIARELRLRQNS